MLVIMDLEWIEAKGKKAIPTQIAAIRVDKQWNVVDRYSSLIKPFDLSNVDWKHVAYTGAPPIAFVGAKGAHRVLSEITEWLQPSDEVCWWHDEAPRNYKNLLRAILKQNEQRNHRVIGSIACNLFTDGLLNIGSPYALMRARGIPAPKPKHHSENDVEAIRLLLSATAISQEDLLAGTPGPIKKVSKGVASKAETNVFRPGLFPFWVDLETNIIHNESCPIIAQSQHARGYGTLKNALKHHLKHCACCRTEYRKAVVERNLDIINRSQYNYVYMSNSNVFHMYNCRMIHSASRGTLLGTINYDACLATGRVPCRVCNPTPYAEKRPLQVQENNNRPVKTFTPARFYDGANRAMNKDEKRAYTRYSSALKERSSLPSSVHLDPSERKDFLTLTQSNYAFWAGRGYSTFHRRNCPKLNGLTDILGFALYEDAVRRGLSPCKHCKPKQKEGIHISIPISSHVRRGETPEMLDSLCDIAGYKHEYADPYYYITTPIGKWRLEVHARPVKLDHINLVRAPIEWEHYHQQPRIFLSLSDTFSYIDQHDRTLWVKVHPNGTEYPSGA